MIWLLLLLLVGVGVWNLLVGMWIMACIIGAVSLLTIWVGIEQAVHDW